MKIEYVKENANQLSGELASLVLTRVMEQANKESNNGYNRELVKQKEKCDRCINASYHQP